MNPTEAGPRALDVRALYADQIRALYAERMKRDFPPDELKPLPVMETALSAGHYACYGAALGGEIVTGKDYLRMARSEAEARRLFQDKLKAALAGDNIIYVVSEMDHLALVPDGTVRVLVRADLDTIKARFRERMRGNLPAPVTV